MDHIYIQPACITCNKAVQDGIYNSTFFPNLLAMLSAFIVVGLLVIILAAMANRRQRAAGLPGPDPVPLAAAATILGIGLGGFADGIVLHQLLQFHQMLSAKIGTDTVTAKSVNMFWDGVFHLFTLLVTLTGCILTWKLLHRPNINRSGYLFSGGLLLGWGMFNIVEGVIDHQVLNLHNVYEYTTEPALYNYAFLGLSVVLVGVGVWLMRRGSRIRIDSKIKD